MQITFHPSKLTRKCVNNKEHIHIYINIAQNNNGNNGNGNNNGNKKGFFYIFGAYSVML